MIETRAGPAAVAAGPARGSIIRLQFAELRSQVGSGVRVLAAEGVVQQDLEALAVGYLVAGFQLALEVFEDGELGAFLVGLELVLLGVDLADLPHPALHLEQRGADVFLEEVLER